MARSCQSLLPIFIEHEKVEVFDIVLSSQFNTPLGFFVRNQFADVLIDKVALRSQVESRVRSFVHSTAYLFDRHECLQAPTAARRPECLLARIVS